MEKYKFKGFAAPTWCRARTSGHWLVSSPISPKLFSCSLGLPTIHIAHLDCFNNQATLIYQGYQNKLLSIREGRTQLMVKDGEEVTSPISDVLPLVPLGVVIL